MTLTATFANIDALLKDAAKDPGTGIKPSHVLMFMALQSRTATMDDTARTDALNAFLATLPAATLSAAVRETLTGITATLEGAPLFDVDSKDEARAAIKAMIRGRFDTVGVELPDADAPEPEPAADDGWADIDFGDPAAAAPAAGTHTGPSRKDLVEAIAPILLNGFVDACSRLPQGADGRDFVAAIVKASSSKTPILDLGRAADQHARLIGQSLPLVAASPKVAAALRAATLPEGYADMVLAALNEAREAAAGGASGPSVLLAIFFRLVVEPEAPAQPEAAAAA